MAGKKPKAVETLSNTAAVARFLAHVYPDGVPAADVPVVTVAQRLAAATDESPGTASLWAQYRDALAELLGMTEEDGDLEYFVDQLSAESRDS